MYFGITPWFDPLGPAPGIQEPDLGKVVFPDMAARKRVTLGKRSGLIVMEREG